MILFTALGVICFLYYFSIAVCSKRWDTTFSGFWVVLGLGFLLCGKAWGFLPAGAQWILGLCFAAAGIAVTAVEAKMVRQMTAVVPEDLEYLIVLGAHVRGTRVTDTLKRRLDRAAEYAFRHPETKIAVSGGRGKGEDISEALAMQRYLIEKGIDEKRIFLEDTSTTTFENLKNTRNLLPACKTARTGITTNNFHIYRALRIAKSAGFTNVYGVPASTKPVVLPNYMAREFFAEIKRIILAR